MYEGPLSVRYEGDPKEAAKHVRVAKTFFERIQSVRKKTGVTTFAGQMRIDDNTFVYALTSGPVNVVQITASPVVPEPVYAIEGTVTPFLGGVVFNGILLHTILPNSGVVSKALSVFAPTARTQTDRNMPPGRQLTTILNVSPHFDDLKSKTEVEYSQYTRLKPTMYTGSMKYVVQAVMSYGRMKVKMTDKDATPTYMGAVQKNGFQVLYDYSFSRTHGITFGSDGEPWLTEISISRGVLITQLPRLSYTKPVSEYSWPFYEKCENEGRTEILAFLDKFKGLPTGESFGTMDIPKGLANGTIIQLLTPEQLADFYRMASYSSVLGWAFNTSGTEAHNTGYFWDSPPNPEIAYGEHHRILFTIGELKKFRKKNEAVVSASASISRIEKGPLIQPGKKPLNIKFYDPLLPGLQSVDVRPALQKDRNYQPDARTPMHVFFVGDELKIVWFNHDGNYEWWQDVDSDMIGCLYGGAWTTLIENGTNRIPTQFSTNDFDERQVIPETRYKQHMKCNDMGYHKWWTDRLDAWPLGYIYRAKIFERITTTESGGTIYQHNACMIPMDMREAVYIGSHIGWVGKNKSVYTSYDSLMDPNYGQSWFWPGFYPGPLGMSAVCGGRHPDRQAVSWTDYSEWNQCSEYADNGPWIGQCESVQDWGSGWPYLPGSSTTTKVEDEHEVKAMLYSATETPELELKQVTWETFESQWMVPSPDPETGLIQNIVMETNTWGADSTLYQPDFNKPFVKTGTTVEPLAEGDGVTFVGVVN